MSIGLATRGVLCAAGGSVVIHDQFVDIIATIEDSVEVTAQVEEVIELTASVDVE